MDPPPSRPSPRRRRFPRTRGDGPHTVLLAKTGTAVSPHTRGWTCGRGRPDRRYRGFPAHAGMDPRAGKPTGMRVWFPRTRGDGPNVIGAPFQNVEVSPHTRGWTLRVGVAGGGGCGFPAHAGMDPPPAQQYAVRSWFPRTRGDGPRRPPSTAMPVGVSPHTRGWTCDPTCLRPGQAGFPAHAGMDPSARRSASKPAWFPRTRGDGPVPCQAVPCHAWVSPHTRGWTPSGAASRRRPEGFPAHAGMDPQSDGHGLTPFRFPRTRGDGPGYAQAAARDLPVSPHTRGWTPARRGCRQAVAGFPAHAGMDPISRGSRSSRHRFPRTRGDGPAYRPRLDPQSAVSPHTRGWTSDQGPSR